MEQYKVQEEEAQGVENTTDNIDIGGFKHSEYVTADFVNQYEVEDEKTYKTSKLKIITIIFLVISLIMCFSMFHAGQEAAGIVSGIQSLLYLISILIGDRVIRAKKGKPHVFLFWFSLLLSIPFFAVYETEDTQRLIWQELELGEMLPELDKDEAVIYNNSDTYLTLSAKDVDYSEYKDYVDSCKEEGYDIGISSNESWFYAYNEEGYELSLYYYDNKDEMSLSLSAPVEKDDIEWPDTRLTNTIPEPESKYGNILTETSEEIEVVLGDVSKREYKDYVNECIDMGYDIDKIESDTGYEAYNSDGYHLVMSYHEYKEEHTIKVLAPLEFDKITWPNSDLAKALPKPDLSHGVFEERTDTNIKVYIGNTSYDEFEDYIDECKDEGFDMNTYEYENYFNGENRDGDDLTIRYLGNNTMYISVYNYDRD